MMPLGLTLALGLCAMLVQRSRARRLGPDPAFLAAPPARLLRYPSLMGPRRASDILYASALHADALEPSTTTGNVLDYRRSKLLWHGEAVAPDLAERMRAMAPECAEMLGIAPFPMGELETQVTVSSGGDYFKRHDDNGSPETRARRISWVYYLHRTPRPFQGGELVVYGARLPDGTPGSYVIEPENDTLIVFPAETLHEVRPVRAPSCSPLDARVTVNGWIREAI